MQKPEVRRVYRQFTPEERERWLKARAQVEAELPELVARHRQLRDAAAEPTLSGAIRRAVHRAGLMLPTIARQASIPESELHEFLLGDRNLRSDVLDRLARALEFEFPESAASTSPTDRPTRGLPVPVPPLDGPGKPASS